ncbi:type IX secretion/gliding motility protein PorT/SprT [Catalinimonas niigatensis]|uniref:type IX secretion/gliding motility protein PorT/SprT n=1 Tax=Catalinimonas niigatensis TaxID=1397264 RepID=UPI002665B104|nr:porin family protein [Catalinimonas niigatensis]WPP49010.1 porin family protein [Catalinimonas niigatensis]
MQDTHIWHQFHLHGQKVVLFCLLLITCFFSEAEAQLVKTDNLPNYDNRWLHYGFSIGMHSSSYRLQYNDNFTSPEFDSLHSIMPSNSFGFSLGLIANFRLAEFLDLRVTPEVVFYENKLDYNYIRAGQSISEEQTVETTFVEFPVLLKYKSMRRGNTRMYLIGGIEPGIEATGKKKDQNDESKLLVNGTNLSAQVGFGLDIYFPLFKFAPEIRFSRGLLNMKNEKENPYGAPIQQLATNTVTLYLLFE